MNSHEMNLIQILHTTYSIWNFWEILFDIRGMVVVPMKFGIKCKVKYKSAVQNNNYRWN